MTELIRPEDAAPSLEGALLAAPEAVARLSEILAQEFEALKSRDLTAFELAQDKKTPCSKAWSPWLSGLQFKPQPP